MVVNYPLRRLTQCLCKSSCCGFHVYTSFDLNNSNGTPANLFEWLRLYNDEGAMRIALGGVATGVFSNSTALWQQIQQAGAITGDRMWRFPLWEQYSKRMTDFTSVDVNNVGKGKGGGSCTAAAFLREFAPPGEWMHLDIAGTMFSDDHSGISYLQKGMTGRPTRTLVQLLIQTAAAKH